MCDRSRSVPLEKLIPQGAVMLFRLRSLVACYSVLVLTAVAFAEDKTATEPKPAPTAMTPADLSGNWSGTWLSHSNGHDGPITGKFRKIDDEHYSVHFSGRFWGLFPF